MALILNIDTATETAGISLAQDGNVLLEKSNPLQRDHAAWIHVAIAQMLKEAAVSINAVQAIAVVGGPGSYTGLRVGMATAKGIAYSKDIPLIVLNTLELMSFAASGYAEPADLLCPMLDARRMEVFTAIYDATLKTLLAPCAMVLDTESFKDWSSNNRILFFGSGAEKWKNLQSHDNLVFLASNYGQNHTSTFSNRRYIAKEFDSLAYSTPIYIKDFHSNRPN